MKIAEIFYSRQGEGLLTGQASVFVRASGCNLRCWFCDTPYTSWAPEGDDLSVDQIIERLAEFDCRHVVLTGGEPLLFAELSGLTFRLRAANYHITIETAGTRYLPVACDLLSLSPKFASSAPKADEHPDWYERHQARRHAPQVVRQLIAEHPYQIKFVIDQRHDLQEVNRWLAEFPEVDRDRVLLMPQGTDPDSLADRAAWLEPLCASAGFRYCPRKQIEWFGFVRGT